MKIGKYNFSTYVQFMTADSTCEDRVFFFTETKSVTIKNIDTETVLVKVGDTLYSKSIRYMERFLERETNNERKLKLERILNNE